LRGGGGFADADLGRSELDWLREKHGISIERVKPGTNFGEVIDVFKADRKKKGPRRRGAG
jgi:hypothetical protein